jgi:hypothetical protein
MRVLLGILGKVACPGRHGGSAEGKESQAGRHDHDTDPCPRRPPGGPGSTGAMRTEGGDRGPLAGELGRRSGGTGGVQELLQCGEIGTDGVAVDQALGLGGADAVESSRTHRMKKSAREPHPVTPPSEPASRRSPRIVAIRTAPGRLPSTRAVAATSRPATTRSITASA